MDGNSLKSLFALYPSTIQMIEQLERSTQGDDDDQLDKRIIETSMVLMGQLSWIAQQDQNDPEILTLLAEIEEMSAVLIQGEERLDPRILDSPTKQ